jgi:glucosamine-6-phosphate deaminase
VELAESTRRANARIFDDPQDVPKHALTMGVGSILQARAILLVAKGKDKAEAIRRALKGPITTDCPASLLQLHPRVVCMLDQEAGELL